MKKRIVFDLDNTLLMWEDKYIFALEKVLDELHVEYTKEEMINYDNHIYLYEHLYNNYNIDDYMNFTRKYFNSYIPDEFYNMLISYQEECYTIDEELISTLKYLSSKYDLVVLTNWFTKTQTGRLKNSKVLEYFTFVSGGDERVLKPDLHAFNIVFDKYKPSECIMVGDSFRCDIEPAIKLGMDYYWITDKLDSNYNTIENVYKLKDIL